MLQLIQRPLAEAVAARKTMKIGARVEMRIMRDSAATGSRKSHITQCMKLTPWGWSWRASRRRSSKMRTMRTDRSVPEVDLVFGCLACKLAEKWETSYEVGVHACDGSV